jgi:RHS repeat-associated protein
VDDGERYAYGADRVRVRKVATRLVVGGAEPVVETREVVYCGGGQERVRVARNGTLVLERWTTHVSDGDRRVAVIDRHVVDTLANEVDAIGPARVRYHLTTPQGSTAVELDEAGLLVSYEEYLPHGGSAFIAGDDVREVARRDVRYAGKERDRATGLDAYPQRYYAPWLGRWLSPDPIGPKDGLNLYAFVGGDPVGYMSTRRGRKIPHSPAAFVWEAALDFMRYSGTKLAEETGQYRCMVPGLREASSSDCVKKWDELDKLLPSAKEGPSLLREALLDSYEARALEVASRNQLIGSAANAVLSVLAIRSALRVEVVSPRVPVPAGAATGRGAVAEAAPPKAFSGAQARENADALAADTGRASVTAPSRACAGSRCSCCG